MKAGWSWNFLSRGQTDHVISEAGAHSTLPTVSHSVDAARLTQCNLSPEHDDKRLANVSPPPSGPREAPLEPSPRQTNRPAPRLPTDLSPLLSSRWGFYSFLKTHINTHTYKQKQQRRGNAHATEYSKKETVFYHFV